MASTPATNAIGVELQAAGENLNTWGDPKLNNALQVLVNLAHGWKAWTINGNYVPSETNYATNNDTENAFIKLVAGTVAAAFNVTLPGRAKRLIMWNATSYAATLKLAATTGVVLPAGGFAIIATDGATDVYNASPTHAGTTTQAGDSNAYALWGAVQAAIATASLPASAGTLLVSALDTTAGYLGTKLVEGTGVDITDSGAGNSTLTISVDTTELEEFLALTGKLTATITSGTTAMTDKRRYRITGGTGTLPTFAATSFMIVEMKPAAGTTVTIGRNSQTIDGTAEDDTYVGTGGSGVVVLYKYSAAGAVTSEIIGSLP